MVNHKKKGGLKSKHSHYLEKCEYVGKILIGVIGFIATVVGLIEGYHAVKSRIEARKAAEIYNSLGNHFYQRKEYDKSLLAFENATLIIPFNYEIFANKTRAKSMFIAQKYGFKKITDMTIEDVNNINQIILQSHYLLKINPNDPDAFKLIGIANFLSGKFDEAKKNFFKSEKIKRTSEIFIWQGVLSISIKDYNSAESFFMEAQKIDPLNQGAFLNMGILEFNRGNFKKAIEQYNKILDIESDNFIALNNRANAYGELKDYQKAIDDYSRAIEINPDFSQAYKNRALIFNKQGRMDRAGQDFEKAKEIESRLQKY